MYRYCIDKDLPLKEAFNRLNKLHNVSMTLFVIDKENRMVGTLTDGDLRRAIVAGCGLESTIEQAMNRTFHYLEDKKDIRKLKVMREQLISLVPLLDEQRHLLDIIDMRKQKSILPIDAVLMAGGKGERLRPLTQTCPKPLLKIGDKAIIDRNVESLAEYGVKNISVTVNYLKEQLIDHYSKLTPGGITVKCVAEDKFYGTIGSLRLVDEFDNDTILVMNSDLLTDIDYEDFYLHFQEYGAMMSAAAIPYTISIPYGIFNLEGREIKSVAEKPIYNLYANAGIYMIKKEALRYIPEGKVFNATDLIDTLAADGQKVIRYPLSGLWIDIGTPEEYRKAQDLIKHK